MRIFRFFLYRVISVDDYNFSIIKVKGEIYVKIKKKKNLLADSKFEFLIFLKNGGIIIKSRN